MLTKRYNLSLIAIIEDIMRVDSRQVVNQQKLRKFFSQTYQRHCWQDRKPKQRKRTRQLREEFGALLYYYYWCDVDWVYFLIYIKMNFLAIVHCTRYLEGRLLPTRYVILVATVKCVTRIFFPLQVTLGESRKTSFFIHCEK